MKYLQELLRKHYQQCLSVIVHPPPQLTLSSDKQANKYMTYKYT